MINKSNAQMKENNGIGTLSKLLPFLMKHKGLIVLGTLATLVGISISLFFGFAIQYVIDSFPSDSSQASEFLNNALVVALSVIFTLNLVQYLAGYNLEKVSVKVTEDIRCRIFKNIISQNIEYMDRQSSGDIQTRIVADTSAVGSFLANQIPTIVTSALMLIGGIVGAFYISTKLTLIIICCVPFIFLPFIMFSKKLRMLGESVRTAISEVGRFSGEIFRNIKVVRAYNMEKVESQEFASLASRAVVTRLRTAMLQIGLSRIVETLATIGFAVLLWSAAIDIYSKNMTLGELVGFSYFALLIVRSAATFFSVVTSLNIAVGTAKKVIEYLSLEKLAWKNNISDFTIQGEIKLENVSFRYPTRTDTIVLDHLSLKIDVGSQIALVGPSGAGKSTIFELLLRFYNTNEGNIYIDGNDIESFDSKKLRSSIGYVPQKESLITGSVVENISYGCIDADLETVKSAAVMACANDFIQNLPEGYETDLGEVGARLSGGQKQRLSLARALLRNPRILLLDEAKSGLDSSNEKTVSAAIEDWARKANATVITITHSLSTVKNADKIIVMDSGKIVGQGSHEYLLNHCDVYKRLTVDEFQVDEPVEELVAEEIAD